MNNKRNGECKDVYVICAALFWHVIVSYKPIWCLELCPVLVETGSSCVLDWIKINYSVCVHGNSVETTVALCGPEEEEEEEDTSGCETHTVAMFP